MEYLIDFDNWLLEIHEGLSNRVQRLIGLDCFFLARACIVCATIATAGIFVYLFLHGDLDLPFFIIAVALVAFVSLFYIFTRISQDEKRTLRAMRDGLKNPRAIEGQGRRISTMISSTQIAVGSSTTVIIFRGKSSLTEIFEAVCAMLVVFLLIFIAEYFRACTPLPPGRSSLKKWIDMLKAAFQQHSNPLPSPA